MGPTGELLLINSWTYVTPGEFGWHCLGASMVGHAMPCIGIPLATLALLILHIGRNCNRPGLDDASIFFLQSTCYLVLTRAMIAKVNGPFGLESEYRVIFAYLGR